MMPEFATIIVIPLLLSILGGIVVVVIEYWVIQPLRQQQKEEEPVTRSRTTSQPRNTSTRANAQNRKPVTNTIFSMAGIYPFNVNRIIISLVFIGSYFLTAGAISLEQVPEKFLPLMSFSGLCFSIASSLSFYIDRDHFRRIDMPLWQKLSAIIITIFFMFLAPYYILIMMYSMLGINN